MIICAVIFIQNQNFNDLQVMSCFGHYSGFTHLFSLLNIESRPCENTHKSYLFS